MRAFGWAAAVSLAAHASLGAALGVRAARVPLGIVAAQMPEPAPVVVDLVEVVATKAEGEPGLAIRAAASGRRAQGRRAIGKEQGIESGEPSERSGDEATGTLAMRYREPIGRLDGPEVAAPERRDPEELPGLDFLRVPSNPLRPAPEVAPSPKSRADLGATVARRDAHGRLTFKDRRNLHVRLAIPSRRELGAMIDNWLADPMGTALAADADPLAEYHERESRSGEPGDNANAKNTFIGPVAAGGFDITDALTRASGADPYLAKKLQYLDRTREERAQIASARRAVDLDDSVAKLRGHLDRIWRRRDLSPRQRKAILFELWDECLESGSENDLRAAALARATIVGFVRRELPRGSTNGYTQAELAALNRGRTSRRRFDPYADAAR